MDTKVKNRILKTLSELLFVNRQMIIKANQKDLSYCSKTDQVMYDRVKVDDQKITGMIASIQKVIDLDDPEGKLLYSFQHDNGLKIVNKSVPFGTILIIFESRPDVTIEAAIIAFKAGNKVLLKGGKEAKNTNMFLEKLWQNALTKHGIDKNYVSYLDIDREETRRLIKEGDKRFDLIIPRGGEDLINFVVKNSTVPVIISGRGNNFLYVDSEADFEMAIRVILNGKQRISVCNALDKVLINKRLPDLSRKVTSLLNKLFNNKIDVYGDKEICKLSSKIQEIKGDSIFWEEFLAAKILLSLVDNIDEAISLVNKYSGGHSASIITANNATAEKFLQEIDCAAVYHNASVRFTDGGQFGLGSEIAVSTQKLHFRGPVGLNQLVTNKWFVYGNGQMRI